MKFMVEISGTMVLLTAEQMQAITDALCAAQIRCDLDVGKGNGDHGYADQYIYGVKDYDMSDRLVVKVMTDDQFEALKFVTQQQKEKNV